MKKSWYLLLILTISYSTQLFCSGEDLEVKREPEPSRYIVAAKGVGLGTVSLACWACGLLGLGSSLKRLLEGHQFFRPLTWMSASGCLLLPAYKMSDISLKYLRKAFEGKTYEHL
jgi:hypothetical protein